MKRSIFKPIIAGVLFGTALFFAPFFLLRVMVFFLIAGLLFRLFAGRRFGHYRGHHMRMAFADKIRNMNEAEYAQFKEKFQHSHGYCGKQQAD